MYKVTKEAIEDILSFRRSVTSYTEMTTEEQRKVIAAFLVDPDSDHDDILSDVKHRDLKTVISLFMGDEVARGITLQNTWKRVIEDNYKAFLSDLVNEVVKELEAQEPGYLSEQEEWLQSDHKERVSAYRALFGQSTSFINDVRGA